MSQSGVAMPPATTKSDESPRRVGVEFELQGIPVDMLARLTAFGDREQGIVRHRADR